MDNFFLTEKDEESNNYLSARTADWCWAGTAVSGGLFWFTATSTIRNLREGAAWAEDDGVRNKEEGKKWEHALDLAHSVHGYILNK